MAQTSDRSCSRARDTCEEPGSTETISDMSDSRRATNLRIGAGSSGVESSTSRKGLRALIVAGRHVWFERAAALAPGKMVTADAAPTPTERDWLRKLAGPGPARRSNVDNVESRSRQDLTAPRFLELAEAAELGAPDRERHAARLLEAPDAVVAAIEHYLDADPASALRMAAALPMFWQDAGRMDQGRRLTELAIQGWSGPASPAFARSLAALGELAFRQGDQETAERWSRRAIEAGEEAADRRAVALGHAHLARIAYRNGDAPRIEEAAQRALNAAGDDMLGRRGALHMLAWAAHTAGDLELAQRRFEDSLALRRQMGDRLAVAVEVSNLGDLAAERGDLAEGAGRLAEALREGVDLRSNYLVLNLLPSIGAIASRVGDDETFARLLGATDSMSASSGLAPDPGIWQQSLGDASDRLGPRFAVLREDGRALDEQSAVDLALRVADAVHDGQAPA